MRRRILFAAVLLAGCSSPEVTTLGPNQYRATQATRISQPRGQGAVAARARSFCAERGQRAELQLGEGQMSSIWNSGTAVADFSCVPK
ncbi:hypothetical protein D9599_12100 [Roseomonas sp. KE2513]|uniref:hypothetical protein n=1 Tax=Roseomonas sp. KE2513 TaxID=2479202 RepID=UPI0018E04C50|nr:hypothetical protein [Roseomonas sp. KE2513]MBI0536317.1 hypothetical protein [Roseomonas sp. KE2513]